MSRAAAGEFEQHLRCERTRHEMSPSIDPSTRFVDVRRPCHRQRSLHSERRTRWPSQHDLALLVYQTAPASNSHHRHKSPYGRRKWRGVRHDAPQPQRRRRRHPATTTAPPAPISAGCGQSRGHHGVSFP